MTSTRIVGNTKRIIPAKQGVISTIAPTFPHIAASLPLNA
jgi:hypothetical protein